MNLWMIGKIFLCGCIGIFFLHYTNRLRNVAKLFLSVFYSESYDSQDIIDGEPAAIEGDVIVNEPAYAANRIVENTDPAVGAYLWRATFPNNTNIIDFKNRTVKEGKVTFASGIESGRFSVAGSNRTIRIDPTWLLDFHDGIRLSELTVSGIHSHIKIAIPLWQSPSIHLTCTKASRTLDQISDLINAGDSEELERYHIESKPIRDGTTIAVCGNIRIEQGEPVVHGTDTLPLAISDQGFDGLRKKLQLHIVKNGFMSTLFLGTITFSWFYL